MAPLCSGTSSVRKGGKSQNETRRKAGLGNSGGSLLPVGVPKLIPAWIRYSRRHSKVDSWDPHGNPSELPRCRSWSESAAKSWPKSREKPPGDAGIHPCPAGAKGFPGIPEIPSGQNKRQREEEKRNWGRAKEINPKKTPKIRSFLRKLPKYPRKSLGWVEQLGQGGKTKRNSVKERSWSESHSQAISLDSKTPKSWSWELKKPFSFPWHC